MPLKVEMYSPKRERWIMLFEIKPGEKPCVIPERIPLGVPCEYVLYCAEDNSGSSISESRLSRNANLPDGQNLEIKQLGVGESYQLQIHTYGSPPLKTFRLTHI